MYGLLTPLRVQAQQCSFASWVRRLGKPHWGTEKEKE
jgi:hypothetical protein